MGEDHTLPHRYTASCVLCITANFGRRRQMWVIRDRSLGGENRFMSAMPRKRRRAVKAGRVAMGHVWTAPSWQGLSLRRRAWSEQPCVRPVSAVHVTAGHNALRGSGPGQKHAFEDAVARVGRPDRQIDRLCITCCSPFPTITSRRIVPRRAEDLGIGNAGDQSRG